MQSAISGTYRGSSRDARLELRVDVDGARTLNCVSGDLFRMQGDVQQHERSFVVDRVEPPQWSKGRPRGPIRGRCRWSAKPPEPEIAIELLGGEPARARVTLGRDVFECRWQSPFFRRVEWELACVESAERLLPFVLDRPRNLAPLGLTVQDVYAAAAVELTLRETVKKVPADWAGPNERWSEEELNEAMRSTFSRWRPDPQWVVFTLIATYKSKGERGCMFDKIKDPPPRQGCAVFAEAFATLSGPQLQRAVLRTCVHELGHCFNLQHAFDRAGFPPQPPAGAAGGCDALTWMNVPEKYASPGGAGTTSQKAARISAYWKEFPFAFTDRELMHLRHAFYMDIVFGGHAFAPALELADQVTSAATGKWFA